MQKTALGAKKLQQMLGQNVL